jgi:preprotein translocase subunit SecA
MKIPDDVPIENKRVTGAIASAQAQVESQNFETRKNILKYDDVMSRQREVVYAERRRVLEGADLHDQIRGMIRDTITGYVTGATEGFPEEWDLAKLWTALQTLYPVGVSQEQLTEEVGGIEGLSRDFLLEELLTDANRAYDRREEELGSEVVRELERQVLLAVLDRKWREHLYEMDYLREGIGLRAYSQRDPLVEYQREGFELFTAMMDSIKEESVGFLFNVEVQMADPELEAEAAALQAEAQALGSGLSPQNLTSPVAPPEPARLMTSSTPAIVDSDGEQVAANGASDHRPHVMAKGLSQPTKPKKLSYTAPTVDGDAAPEVQVADDEDPFGKVSRNAPCPCGSGRKYKRCHGDPARRNA